MDTNYYKKYEPIFGSWYIDRLIGEGSFGKVYEIQREDFGITYKAALKTIAIPTNQSELRSAMADGMDEASVREYFGSFVKELTQEIALMSKLKGNSNIVSYENHRVIEHKDGIGWDILIQMELLTPLNDYISKHTITRQDVIKIGIDMCKALELCQKFNIIHRDVKPENMFISENGDFKLGDFGIARTVEKTTSGLSKKGTYSYMAPEVYKGEDYGSTVDIYSLGIVLYRLLNENRTPFLPAYPAPITHADRENALAKRFSGAPLPLPVHGEGRLGEIVMKACSYDPAKRYSSPMQMRQELEAILYNREEGRYIYPDGDDVPQQSIQYVETGEEPPVSDFGGTVSDFGGAVGDPGGTASDFGGAVGDPGGTVSDFGGAVGNPGGTVSDFGAPPIGEGSAPTKKIPVKGILIGVGVLFVGALIALLAWDSAQGTPMLDSVMAEYGNILSYNDGTEFDQGYYSSVLDAVAGEMGYVTFPNNLPPEALNTAVQNGEYEVGISFAGAQSEGLQESEPFTTDTFVLLTGVDDLSTQVSDLGELLESGTYRIGVVKDTLEHAVAEWETQLRDYEQIVVYDSASDALTSDEVFDGLLLHKQTAEKMIAQNPEFVLGGVELTYSHTFKVSQKDSKLLQKLNDAIAATKSALADITAQYTTQWNDEEQAVYDEYMRNWAMGFVSKELSTMDTDTEVVRIGVLTAADSRTEVMYLAERYPTVEIGGETYPVQIVFIEAQNVDPLQMAQNLSDHGVDVVIEANDLGGMSEEMLQSFSAALKEANIPVVAARERSEHNASNYVEDHSYPIHFAVEYLGVETVVGYDYFGKSVVDDLGAVYDTAGKYWRGEAELLDNSALYIDFDRIIGTDTSNDWDAYRFWGHYGATSPVVTTSEDMYDEIMKMSFYDNLYYIVQENYGRYLEEKDSGFVSDYYNWIGDFGLGSLRLYPTDAEYEYHDMYLAVLHALEMDGDLYQNLENTVFEGLTGSFYFAPGNMDRLVANYVSRPSVNPKEGLISYTMSR